MTRPQDGWGELKCEYAERGHCWVVYWSDGPTIGTFDDEAAARECYANETAKAAS